MKEQSQNHTILLAEIIDMLPGTVYAKNSEGVFITCNKQQAVEFGFNAPQDIIGKNDFDLLSKETAEAAFNLDQNIMKTGYIHTVEETVVKPTGVKTTYLSQKKAIKNKNGESIGIIGISFDITSEKEAENLKIQNKIMEEQIELLKQLSASVAHELRTPLTAMKMTTETIKEWLPDIVKGYQLAREKNLPVREINAQVFEEIKDAIKTFNLEIAATFLFINMFLNNIQQKDKINTKSFREYSIKSCVEEALKRYPFFDLQKEKVFNKIDRDFKFHGDSELFIHIVYNLLKNALYYIAGYHEAKIEIWTSEDKKYNILHFKDTGEGMEEEVLSHIFERFYSKTYHGTGVGLAYCKMVMEVFGGDIICRSERGKYTEFVLSFPKDYH